SPRRHGRIGRPRSGRWNPAPTGRVRSTPLCAASAPRGAADNLAARTLPRGNAARRRLTRAGDGAWFGAFDAGRLQAQLGVCDAGGGRARYQDVETDPAARRHGLAGPPGWLSWRV